MTLPDNLGALTGLQLLWIGQCSSLTQLPTSIGFLSSLRHLMIQGCGELQSVPESIKQLNALYLLTILDCGSLEGLGCIENVERPAHVGMHVRHSASRIMSESGGQQL